jgi:hypothetical protein
MREEFQHTSSIIKIKAGTTDIFWGPFALGQSHGWRAQDQPADWKVVPHPHLPC